MAAGLVGLAVAAAGSAYAEAPSLRGRIGDEAAVERYNWAGFYAGGAMGGSRRSIAQAIAVPTDAQDADVHASGIRGMYAGMQGQWGSLVIGLEASLINGAIPMRRSGSNADLDAGGSSDWSMMLTPRLGYAVDNTMFYVKGGFISRDAAGVGAADAAFQNGVQPFSASRREDGWTAGAGIERAITRWAAIGLDYSYVHIDSGARGGSSSFVSPSAVLFNANSKDVDVHQVMSKLTVLLGEAR